MNKDLKITISVDKKTGAVKAVDGEMKELGRSTIKTNKETNSLKKNILGFASVAGSIYILKQAFDVTTNSILSLTKTAGNFESQKSILETLEGNAQKAEKSFEWVKKFSKDTPYQMEKVLESFVKAKSYGIDPTNGSLLALGDAAAGMKKDITQAVEAMADAMTGENERLKEFGIRASVEGENITYNWTSASGKAKSTTIQNNSEIIQSTLQAIFNSKYQGAMKNMMNTYDGMVSNMADNWTNYKDRLANESGIFDSIKIGISSINEQFSTISDEDFSIMSKGAKVGFDLVLDGIEGAIYGAGYMVSGFSAVETGIEQLGLRGKSTFSHLEKYGIEAYVGIVEAYNTMMPDFLDKDIDLKDSRSKLIELEKEIIEYTKDYYKAEEDHLKINQATASVLEKISKIKKKIKDTGIVSNKDKKDLEKLTKIQKKEYAPTYGDKGNKDKKSNDEYKSIIKKLQTINNDQITNLGDKYKEIAEKLAKSGMATNKDWELLGDAYLKEYESVNEKITKENTEAFLDVIKQWSNIATQALKTLLNDKYDSIVNKYENKIDTLTQSANTLNFRSTSAAAFGQSGVSLEYDYKAQLQQANLQETLNTQYYELSKKAKSYKQDIQSVLELGGLAYAAYGTFTGAGGVDGIEFAINAQNMAEEITGFQQYQSEYIDGVKTFKEQLRELADTLVNISAAMYSSMDTYREYYDRLNSNAYSNLEVVEAANTLSPYTALDKNSLSTFINDILKTQSGFITEGTNTAGANDEELLRSSEIFEKYGLAIDSLNDSFMSSLDVITKLIASQEKANKELKEYSQSIRKNLVGADYQAAYQRDMQINYLNALDQYKSGEITSSELISYAKSFESSLGELDNEKRLALIDSLQGISTPQTTEEYLKSLDDRVAEMQLVGMPVVNVSEMESIDVQTLDAVTDTNSLLEKILEVLKTPIDSALDFIKKIVEAIMEAAEKIIKGIFEGAKRVIKSILDLPKKLAEAIKDIFKGAADIGGSILDGIGGAVSSIGGAFGFADGGYTGLGGIKDSTGYGVRGFVHENEWVMPSHMVNSYPELVNYLESIRIGKPMEIANNTDFGKKIMAVAPVTNINYLGNDSVAQEVKLLRNELAKSNYELVKTNKRLLNIEKERRAEELGVSYASA